MAQPHTRDGMPTPTPTPTPTPPLEPDPLSEAITRLRAIASTANQVAESLERLHRQ